MWNKCISSRRLIGIICKWWNHHSFQHRTTQRTPAILMVNWLCWTEEPKSPIWNLTHFLFSLAARNVLQHLKLSSVDVDDFGRDWIRSIDDPSVPNSNLFILLPYFGCRYTRLWQTYYIILLRLNACDTFRVDKIRNFMKFVMKIIDENLIEKNCETRKPIKCLIFYWIQFASRFFCFVSLWRW